VEEKDVTAQCRVDAEFGDVMYDDPRHMRSRLVAMVRDGYTFRKVRVRVVGDAMTERDAFIIIAE